MGKSFDKPKAKHRKGLWSPEEDLKLRNYVLKQGHGCWSSVPINAGLQRNGKSCRLRWINYLRPGLKRGTFSSHEEETILTLHHLLGNKWSQIAQQLPGRTDNEIKNYWHSYLKKRMAKAEESESQTNKTQYTTSSSENTDSSLSPQNLMTGKTSSYESFQKIHEKLLFNTDQSVPQLVDLPKESRKTSLPKLLFAEWLSLDQEDVVTFPSSSNKPMVSLDGFDQGSTSNLQDPFMNGNLFNDGLFEFHDGLSSNDASVNEMYSSQFKFDTEILGNEFVGSLSGDDVCSNFNIHNDVMYI